MRFSVEADVREGAITVVTVAGDADLYTAPELRAQLLQVIDAGARTLIVDLTPTTFIDSTTLGALIGAVKRLRHVDGEVWLVIGDRSIRKIFEITLLDRVFPIYDTLADALTRAEGNRVGAS